MKQATVDVLLALNEGQSVYQSVLYDKKFVKTAMEDIFSKDALSPEIHLNPRKVEFIKSNIIL
jgi:hypothetical protein